MGPSSLDYLGHVCPMGMEEGQGAKRMLECLSQLRSGALSLPSTCMSKASFTAKPTINVLGKQPLVGESTKPQDKRCKCWKG